METLKNALEFAHYSIDCISFYSEDFLIHEVHVEYGTLMELIDKFGNLVIDSKEEMVDFDGHHILGVHVVCKAWLEDGEIMTLSELGRWWNSWRTKVGYRVESFDSFVSRFEGRFLN